MTARRSAAVLVLVSVVACRSASAGAIWTKLEDLSPDAVSPYVQGSWLHGGTDLEEDGRFLGRPGAMRAVGIELGYAMQRHTNQEGIDLGLGYEYSTGFRSKIPGYDLRAAIHTLPQISLYMDFDRGWGSPYIGARTGVVQLANAQVYDTQGRIYGLEASTFQMGLAVGIVTKLNFFVEGSYEFREFKSPNYKLPAGVNELPREFPRELNASQWTFAIGYQALKAKKAGGPTVKETRKETKSSTEKVNGVEVKTDRSREIQWEYAKGDSAGSDPKPHEQPR